MRHRWSFTIGAVLMLAACDGTNNSANSVSNTALSEPQPVSNEATTNAEGNVTASGPVGPTDSTCQLATCSAGTVVMTSSKSNGIFLSCETEGLSDYANFVVGLIAMQKTLSETMPNIDPETGEPQYEGQTKDMLDALRSKAGVATFDEAVAHCQYGPYRHKVTVINYHKDQTSTWVQDARTSKMFWLPTNEIDPPKG